MYGLVHLVARIYVRSWYRIDVFGDPPPASGPLLVCCNHTNGLMDVALLFERFPRRLRFLAKYTIFTTPVIGPLAKGAHAIPIYRKKDGVPTERNQASFDAVHTALGRGEVVVVFPEGESGTAPHLRLPLKTGIGRMALGAQDEHEGVLVQILPIGIHVHDRNRYRSRLELRYGAPVPVSDLLARYREDPREAVPALMERVAAALRPLGPDLADARDLPLYRLLRARWRRDDGGHHARLDAWTSSPREHGEAAAAAAALVDELARLGLTPEDTVGAQVPALVGVAAGIVVGLATLVWALPTVVARGVAARLAPADKFVTVTCLVAPLLGTLLLTILAIVLALGSAGPVALVLVPAAWLLLAAGTRAADPWRDFRAQGRRRRASKCLNRVDQLLQSLDIA